MFLLVKELSLTNYFSKDLIEKIFFDADKDKDGKINFKGLIKIKKKRNNLFLIIEFMSEII